MLVALPIAAALPLVFTGGGTGAATLYAQFAAESGWLHGALTIPARLARDIGLYLLAVHLALQVSAGFATRRLLVRVGLDGAALAGALLFMFSPPMVPGASGGGAGLGASVALVMLATERCLAPRHAREGGALALAIAIVTLGMFGDPTQLEAGGALACLWAAGRLAGPLPFGRPRAVARLLAGAALGLVVAVPLNTALNVAAGTVGLAGAESAAQSLGEWFGWVRPRTHWHLAPLARMLAASLPLVAVSVLGAARRRAWPVRAALGLAAVLAALVTAWRGGAAGENAAPMLFLALACLAAIAARDTGRGDAASLPLRIGAAVATMAAAAGACLLLGDAAARELLACEAALALLTIGAARSSRALCLGSLAGAITGFEMML